MFHHPSPNSKEGTHQGSPHVTTNYKREIEVQCMNQETHKKEWQEQEKSRQEVRQEIRREFNKQEQGRGRKGQERSKDMVRLHQGDFTVNPNPPRAQKAPAPVVAPSPPAKEQIEGEEKKLMHGDSCKTCVRMNKLTGQVLPHSPNY